VRAAQPGGALSSTTEGTTEPRPQAAEERLGRSRAVELDEVLDQDLDDVPATVVCARCGSAECAGCGDDLGMSGIVAIIAWERPGSFARRLWTTARATTRDADTFFEALPDGPILPALRFAVASELLAAGAMFAALAPVAIAMAPSWAKGLVTDPASRMFAARALAVGVPGLACLLVLAHAVHGLALDVGARRSGARGATSRALRFGLYATGWDLILGPIGVFVLPLVEGPRGLGVALAQASGLPGRSARAFLRGAYGLFADRADRAARASYIAAAVATLIATAVILAAVIALILW